MRHLCFITTTAFSLAFSALAVAQEIRRDTLDASRITAAQRDLTGTWVVSGTDIKGITTPLGDGSAIKFIQTLPGVSTGAEGSSAVFVRGGNLGSNLITLDGVPLYGSGHLLGFSTSYSPDIAAETRFMVGGFTSEEGNLTSSHIKVSTRDGDFAKLSGGVSASPFILGGFLSAPVVKEKVSLFAAARVSPMGMELNVIKGLTSALDSTSGIKAVVFDFFGKLKLRISPAQDLSFSVFRSLDSYGYNYGRDSEDRIRWGNTIIDLKHDISLGKNWHIMNNISYDKFENYQGMRKILGETENSLALRSDLDEASFRSEAIWTGDNGWGIHTGIKVRSAKLNPGGSSEFSDKLISHLPKYENPWTGRVFLAMAHAQVSKTNEGKYNFRVAGRFNKYSLAKRVAERRRNSFTSPELSIMGKVFFVKWAGVEVTADQTVQYYHTLEGIPIGWSMDMLLPSDTDLPPEKTSQIYSGLFASINSHRVSIGGYYKKMDNLTYFRDASQLFSPAAAGWRDNINTGSGSSKGIEVLYATTFEKFSSKVSYTLSKTDRVFPDLNEGKAFPAKFDRRHILNVNAEYTLVKQKDREFGMNTYFTYQSGHWTTIQAGQFSRWIESKTEVVIDYYTSIHNWQMPQYIRWDVGLFWRYRTGSNNPGTLNVGIYNLLNRHNPYNITFDPKDRKWKQLSIFPIMPTISWTMEF